MRRRVAALWLLRLCWGHYSVPLPGGQTVLVPKVLYGTAWKRERTERLARTALDLGHTGLDSCNQPKHYNETGVGAALTAWTGDRATLFVQTKFSINHEGSEWPYDRRAGRAEQVAQSWRGTLDHLGGPPDALLVHSPFGWGAEDGLVADDWAVWGAVAELQRRGEVRMIGVSNFNPRQLRQLLERDGAARPQFVQNRCRARVDRWDSSVRKLCKEHGVIYQAFGLISNNRPLLRSGPVLRAAAAHRVTPAMVLLRFGLELGAMVLSGTQNSTRMQDDLALEEFALSESELQAILQVDTRFDDSTRVQAEFVNGGSVELEVLWRDHNGLLVPNGRIGAPRSGWGAPQDGPAARLRVSSYHSHEFVVREVGSGRVLKELVLDAAKGLEQQVLLDGRQPHAAAEL